RRERPGVVEWLQSRSCQQKRNPSRKTRRRQVRRKLARNLFGQCTWAEIVIELLICRHNRKAVPSSSPRLPLRLPWDSEATIFPTLKGLCLGCAETKIKHTSFQYWRNRVAVD